MATSRNPNTRRRRPPVGDRSATGAATPPGTEPTPNNITTEHHPTEHHSGHPIARGARPMANPEGTEITATAGQPPPHDRAAHALRDVDDPDIDAVLDAVVDAAPPLPYETRARLAWLLRGPQHQSRRDTAA